MENTDKKDFITFGKEAIGQIPLDIKFKKLDERAVIPSYAHDGDVGMDMTAIDVEYDKEHDMYIYHTGLAFESPKHYGQFLFPRSSNRKTDAYLCNSVGIADSAIYRGEIMFCYKNRDSIHSYANLQSMNMFMALIGSDKHTHQEIIEYVQEIKEDIYKRAENLEFAPYKVGDRIGQMVFLPYPNVILTEYQNLSDTERGDGGFGSTGN